MTFAIENLRNLLFMRNFLISLLALALTTYSFAQSDRWQQHAQYEMNVDFDTQPHRYTGPQTLHYPNNSPDTLNQIFYHLSLNAFQPGSQMDVRSRTIADTEPRVKERMYKLSSEGI